MFFKNKKLLFVLLMIICALAGVSNFITEAFILVVVAVLLSLVIVMFGDDVASLYLMIALIPFYGSLNLNGVAFGFIIPLLTAMKMIFRNISNNCPPTLIIGMLFLMIWFVHDVQYNTFMGVFTKLCMPLYIFLAISFLRFEKYDGYYAAWIVIISSIIAMCSIFIVQGGSLSSFVFTGYAGEMRLGEADTDAGMKNQLDGAMGFPIYTITILTLFIQMFMTRKLELWKKLSIMSVSLGIFFITFLTISRVYLLGLGTLFLMMGYYILHRASFKTSVSIVLSLLLITFVALQLNPEIVDSITEQYTVRIDSETDNNYTGSRGYIYKDCIAYLLTNIECLFIGKGNSGYIAIGQQLNTNMSMSAHNVILDGLLSFGVLGFFFLIKLYYQVYKREVKRMHIKANVLHLLPLGCILMMYNTSSPFTLEKVWPFLLFLVLNVTHCTDGVAKKQ